MIEQKPKLFDAEDLRIAGRFLVIVILVLIGSAVAGVAVRIFLLASGLR